MYGVPRSRFLFWTPNHTCVWYLWHRAVRFLNWNLVDSLLSPSAPPHPCLDPSHRYLLEQGSWRPLLGEAQSSAVGMLGGLGPLGVLILRKWYPQYFCFYANRGGEKFFFFKMSLQGSWENKWKEVTGGSCEGMGQWELGLGWGEGWGLRLREPVLWAQGENLGSGWAAAGLGDRMQNRGAEGSSPLLFKGASPARVPQRWMVGSVR